MKLSFIIPTYNCKTYFQECLASIQSQTMQDFECIVVDDESVDGTYEWCIEAAKADIRIKPIRLKHCNAANCRNAGIDLAKGEYVWIVDSDDILVANAAERVISFIEENDLEMAMIDGKAFFDQAKMLSFMHSIHYLSRKMHYGFATGQEMLCKMIDLANFNCYVFLQVVRRDAIKHKFPLLALDEDLVYTVKNLVEMKQVGHLSEILYKKRCRPQSTLTSKMSLEKTVSLLQAIDLILDWTEEQLAVGRMNECTAKCITTLMEMSASEIKTRFNQLDSNELKKLEELPFRQQARLKILVKASHKRI